MSSSPHDSLFKAVFGKPEHARGALRSMVPPAVAEALAKDTIMTAGERLIQQGEERGIQKGIQQGERGLLVRLLSHRFGSQVNAEVERRVATASAEQIATWAERVLSAATLAEVIAD
jgi:hypothetical protein